MQAPGRRVGRRILLAPVELAAGEGLLRARIRQPKMPVLVWEVTAFEEGREFTWSSHSAGVSTAGIHRVSANPDGTSTVFLAVDQTGVLAPLVGLFTGAQTRRYLGLEAHGLKQRSEGA